VREWRAKAMPAVRVVARAGVRVDGADAEMGVAADAIVGSAVAEGNAVAEEIVLGVSVVLATVAARRTRGRVAVGASAADGRCSRPTFRRSATC
jgi:hypothetical protein